jgi:hypothetical protein
VLSRFTLFFSKRKRKETARYVARTKTTASAPAPVMVLAEQAKCFRSPAKMVNLPVVATKSSKRKSGKWHSCRLPKLPRYAANCPVGWSNW